MASVEEKKARKRLGELLLEAGMIKEQDLENALSRQKKYGGRVGTHLLKIGAVTESVLLEFIHRVTRYPTVDLDKVPVVRGLKDLIPREVAERNLVVPVKKSGDLRSPVLTVALADHTNIEFVDQLQFSTGCRVEPMIATEGAVQRFIRRLYDAAPEPAGIGTAPAEGGEGRDRGEATDAGSIPFVVSTASWKGRFAALAELLITKGVITREELVAKMKKEQSGTKE